MISIYSTTINHLSTCFYLFPGINVWCAVGTSAIQLYLMTTWTVLTWEFQESRLSSPLLVILAKPPPPPFSNSHKVSHSPQEATTHRWTQSQTLSCPKLPQYHHYNISPPLPVVPVQLLPQRQVSPLPKEVPWALSLDIKPPAHLGPHSQDHQDLRIG